ncbi:MAG: ABC transporter substrate-binding protein [Rhodocyclaceae bacterium]|jgi:branched-chain amino acid transport system substrate-binding protein|nr:ABC transporter substrate-binding protein [Rhodocyclaceae bacterium]MCL4758266.1 ABC transporter substrate-binding protein [Rhodocyclaceae bacterium]
MNQNRQQRRTLMQAVVGLAMGALIPLGAAQAADPVKVGMMLPATGTFAALGTAIDNAFKLYVEEQGGKLAGREIQYFAVDDESDPAKATENANRLVTRDRVDVLVGTVHSGVALAMARVARGRDTLFIVPNAGADDLTGQLCAPNLFRTSFSNWQPAYAMGKATAGMGHKTAVTLTWNYAAGQEAVKGFKQAFEEAGGKVVKELATPFPNVEFQPFLTEIAAIKPDAVYVFFAGGGAVKFVKDYVAAGLKDSVPLYSSGFLTDGTLAAMGGAGEGLVTALHYADGLDNAKDKAFRAAYQAKYGMAPDVYAVQGYDAAQLLHKGLEAVGGDMSKKAEMRAAMRGATIDSPRGAFTLSKAHNPVQDIYLRKAQGNLNPVSGIAAAKLDDPATGCNM